MKMQSRIIGRVDKMTDVGTVLETIAHSIGTDSDRNPNICALCGYPTEFRIPSGIMAGRLVTIPCKCISDEYEREIENRAHMEAQRRVDELKRFSLMDARMKNSTFDNWQDDAHNKSVCIRYVNRFDDMLAMGQGLILTGLPGTGKTFAAGCIANALIEKRIPVIVTSFVKLLGAVGRFGEDAQQVIDRIKSAKLLIIDDLGVERSNDYALEKVYDIIDSRYRTNLPMVLTTNSSIGAMQDETDIRLKRIYDRILDCCYPIVFSCRNWRSHEAEARYDIVREILEA